MSVRISLFISLLILFSSTLSADYETGKKIFKQKCASCHTGYISGKVLEENFYKKDNKLLKLKAPTVNMLSYFLVTSSSRIGDKNDPDMQRIELEEFIKDYLYQPNRNNSVIREEFLKYFDKKESMKGRVSEAEISNITDYIFEYKKRRKKTIQKAELKNLSINDLIKKAKKEHKYLLIEAMSTTCYYCEKMKKEVLSLEIVKKAIEKNYIFIQIDTDKTKLPLGLDKKYKNFTPTFFILNSNGKFLNDYPGAWGVEDFLAILKEDLDK